MTKTTIKDPERVIKELIITLGNLVTFVNDKDHREKAKKVWLKYFYKYPELSHED